MNESSSEERHWNESNGKGILGMGPIIPESGVAFRLWDYHIDGLRYDMTLYIRSVDALGRQSIAGGWGLMAWLNQQVHSYKPQRSPSLKISRTLMI
jgi:hypothetical protein